TRDGSRCRGWASWCRSSLRSAPSSRPSSISAAFHPCTSGPARCAAGSDMSRVRVHSFAISIDGYGAGPHQDLQHPLGENGHDLFGWFVRTRTWQRMQGNADGETGVDDDRAARGFENIGAWILGRNMFGPVRGPWPDESWKGWWGAEPPYHTPVFVLT